MKINKLAFEDTGFFSPLFIDYVNDDESLRKFYEARPAIESFQPLLEKRDFTLDNRNTLHQALRRQYGNLDVSASISENIDSLRDENTFTITTGHQLNIFTGPLYFIYKIATVINTARKLKEAYPGYNFVPVYWMASEDHDFEEISYFYLSGKKYKWKTDQSGPVGRFSTNSLQELLNEIPEQLPFFPKAYTKFDHLSDACRCYVSEIFADYGVVTVDGDDPQLKKIFAPVIQKEILEPVGRDLVVATNESLVQAGYNSQAFTRDINFFHLGASYRERILNENGMFRINGGDQTFSEKTLREKIETTPEEFSPNVIMRPVYQEMILPNLAYVGGPAEIAYWLQLKGIFDHYKIPYPVLLPRNFGLYISRNIRRKIENQKLELADIFADINQLKAAALEKAGAVYGAEEEKASIQQTFLQLAKKAKNIDRSLIDHIHAEEARVLKRLEHVESKFRRAQERNEETTIQQLEAIKDNLFPGQTLQERHDNFLNFYFDNTQFVADIIQAFDPFDLKFHVMQEE